MQRMPLRVLKEKTRKWLPLLLLAFIILLHFSFLLKTLHVDQEGIMRSTPTGYGDIPFHLSEMTYFANDLTPKEEPIFKGEKLQYSFGINYLSALLFKGTDSFRFAFLFPVIFFAVSSSILLYFIFKKLIRSRYLAVLGIALFLLGSGMNVYPVSERAREENRSFKETVEQIAKDNGTSMVAMDRVYPKQPIHYGPPLFMFFMHQRAFIPGLALFLVIFASLLYFFETKKRVFLALLAIFYGILPIFHMHSFIAATAILGISILFLGIKKEWRTLKQILIPTVLGGLAALPQVLYLTGEKIFPADASFPSLRFGWMFQESAKNVKDIFFFEWMNFGFWIFALAIVSYLVFGKNRVKKALHPYIVISFFSSLALLLLANTIQFQSWDFDNNKIIAYSHLLLIPGILYVFSKIIEKKAVLGSILVAISALLLINGGLTEAWIMSMKNSENLPVIFDKESLEVADFITRNIPEEETIVTGTAHLNPAASLSGRIVLVGYPGWLWTRGIDYTPRENELRAFYSDPRSNRDFLSKYNAKYILIDESAKNDFGAKEENFENMFLKMFENGKYSVYQSS